MTRSTAVRVAAGVAMAGSIAWLAVALEPQLFARLTIAGITLGGIYALSGLGLVITYRASGVFNFAHGAIAMVVAYALWQLVRGWQVPLVIAAPVALLVVGPAIGGLLARYVFRPLDQRGASEVENLVATVGIFIFTVGVAVAVWGQEPKTDPVSIFGSEPLELFGSVPVSTDQLAILLVTLVVSVALYWLLERTRFGLRMRAVVERRELAQLSAVDADRVSAAAWAIGAGLAGLTGVLLAPSTFGLDPYHFTLLVAETFAVAVIAKLTSLSLAVVGGIVLGLAMSYQTQLDLASVADALGASAAFATELGSVLAPLKPSLPVVALFAALLVHRRFAGSKPRVGLASTSRHDPPVWAKWSLHAVVIVGLVAAPFVVDVGLERRVLDLMGLAIVFLSIVVVTGLGGHITLGQAAFAGTGAFLTGRLIAGSFGFPPLPVVVATLGAVLLCALLGVLVGYPALRRRGLVFGLTTFAVGLVLERFLFANYELTAGPGAVVLRRPSPFGVALESDVAFHFYVLAALGVAVLVVVALRRGRLGRAVAAMRDSSTAARASGLRVRRYTMLLFVTSTCLAGLGGSVLAQTAQTFASQRFGTFDSVIWFMAVVVAGASSVYGALLAAFALTVVSAFLGDSGIVILLVGLGALFLGRLPGGAVGLVRSWVAPGPPRPRRRTLLEPSPAARELLARREAAT